MNRFYRMKGAEYRIVCFFLSSLEYFFYVSRHKKQQPTRRIKTHHFFCFSSFFFCFAFLYYTFFFLVVSRLFLCFNSMVASPSFFSSSPSFALVLRDRIKNKVCSTNSVANKQEKIYQHYTVPTHRCLVIR